jgi:pilus assembly protein Flp/PilA
MILSLGAWLLARSQRDEDGASLVEYLLLVSLIAVVVIVAIVFLGGELDSKYDGAGSELSNNF